MPSATMWMDLENLMLSEIRQRKTNIVYITYMCSLKNNINECTYKTKIDSQIQKTNLWLSKANGGWMAGGIN